MIPRSTFATNVEARATLEDPSAMECFLMLTGVSDLWADIAKRLLGFCKLHSTWTKTQSVFSKLKLKLSGNKDSKDRGIRMHNRSYNRYILYCVEANMHIMNSRLCPKHKLESEVGPTTTAFLLCSRCFHEWGEGELIEDGRAWV